MFRCSSRMMPSSSVQRAARSEASSRFILPRGRVVARLAQLRLRSLQPPQLCQLCQPAAHVHAADMNARQGGSA